MDRRFRNASRKLRSVPESVEHVQVLRLGHADPAIHLCPGVRAFRCIDLSPFHAVVPKTDSAEGGDLTESVGSRPYQVIE